VRRLRKIKNLFLGLLSSLVIALGLLIVPKLVAQAAILTGGKLSISDSRPTTASVDYTTTMAGVSTGTGIACIRLKFNTAADGSGSVPTGLTTTGGAFNTAGSTFITTWTSWSGTFTANGIIDITKSSGTSTPNSSGTVKITGVTNGSTADTSYFMLFNTYTGSNCSTGPTDSGVIKFIYTAGQAVTMTVDPTLTFTIAGYSGTVNGEATTVSATNGTIPFATVTTSDNAVAAHTLTVNTNAAGGYTVYTRYTGQLGFGGSTFIDDVTAVNSDPDTFPATQGVEAFGYTTDETALGTGTVDRFTNPANQWAKFTTSDAEVAYSGGPVSNDVTHVAYQAGIAGDTKAGAYTTTIIFTATPTY
jgi:hypothetical protein